MSLSPGRFPCVVVQTRLGQAQSGPELAIVVECFPSVEDRAGKKNALGRITHYRYFSDRGFEYAVATLKEFGWDPREKWGKVKELDAGEKSPLVGMEAEVVIKQEEYEGKPRLKVEYLNGPHREMREPVKESLDSAGLDALSARLKSWDGSAATSGAAAAASGADDDTPF